MLLLDFPPEIFQNIIHELVAETGACGAWKLRSVSKVFDAEIRYDVLVKQPQSIPCRDNSHDCIRLQQHITTLHLVDLIHNPRNHDTRLLSIITDLAQYVCGELGLDDIEQGEIIESLCKGAVKHLDSNIVLEHLWSVRPNENVSDGHLKTPSLELSIREYKNGKVQERMVAAIAADAYGLVIALMSTFTPESTATSSVFGEPLQFAISIGNHEMVEIIIEKFLSLRSVIPRKYINFIGYFGSQIACAVPCAIAERRLAILHTLVEAFKIHKIVASTIRRTDFDKWLLRAIRTRTVDFVRAVLDIPINSGAKVSLSVFITACNQGIPDIVTALIGDRLMDPNKEFMDATPLIVATRTGNLDVVKAVLDAGAYVNGVSKSSDTALEQALMIRKAPSMEKREAAVRLLLSYGATLPPFPKWPITPGLWDIFRETNIARGAMLPPPTFKLHRTNVQRRIRKMKNGVS
ncbi:hypothetical protein P280DRAFT_522896 [Massarina eburnea CBS 473.64]|uniref:Uncharacterized protein n=1 Tax=Massarina eburnea CBS 473.64 TaxID=1395130 RepID=A0A6A6RJS4_9PLEO|nr:hypothetical protein P280DRAFT_522896 [Massarina eburnea CBS 473.64]